MIDRISTDDMRQFLVTILPGVNDAPNGDDRDELIDLRAMAGAVACEHLPAAILDDGAKGDALRTFDTWPSAAAIYQFLKARVRDGARPSHPEPRVVRSEMPPWRASAPPPVAAPLAGRMQSIPAPQPPDGPVKSE